MKRHLKICIRTEEAAGRIYRRMLESPLLNSRVRQTLHDLANDEDDHASQLRFALHFPENSVVKSPPKQLEQAQELLEMVLKILERDDLVQVDAQQVISIGLDLEKNFCQVHIANSFEFTEQGLKEMFAAMAKADELHCQRLLDLKASLAQS
jgi:rubrerythrin